MMIMGITTANAHDSHTHEAPWQACAQKQIKEECEYTNGSKDLFKGSCQLFNKSLMCVRNEPILYFKDLSTKAKEQVRTHANKEVHSHQ